MYILRVNRMEFRILTQWDSVAIDHEPVQVKLTKLDNYVGFEVDAPFFDDPKPDGEVGKPFPNLWDYEVVEAFFLGADDKYLEIELNPHGQHLVLLLNGRRNMIKDELSLEYESKIDWDKKRWTGSAKIPQSYFPFSVGKFNAYAIHGTDTNRIYEALYPAENGKHQQPDFHRLEYFKPIDISSIVDTKVAWSSHLWKDV